MHAMPSDVHTSRSLPFQTASSQLWHFNCALPVSGSQLRGLHAHTSTAGAEAALTPLSSPVVLPPLPPLPALCRLASACQLAALTPVGLPTAGPPPTLCACSQAVASHTPIDLRCGVAAGEHTRETQMLRHSS